MIQIDGRAGGQVLRTSLALSAVVSQPATIFNIRANRPNPGLQAQHLAAVNTAAKLSNAEVNGNFKGSKKIVFRPKKFSPASFSVNIGTAGSVSLLLQSIMLPSILAENPVSLRIKGGTDVKWSPPIDYVKEVLFPVLKKMGCRFELDLVNRGHYPKGGGTALFKSRKPRLPLRPVEFKKRGSPWVIELISHCKNLPKEVALNQATSARQILSKHFSCEIREKIEHSSSGEGEGSGILVLARFHSSPPVTGSALGGKGVDPLKAGRTAANIFLNEFNSGKPVESFLADQLIPFLAAANGASTISVTSLSEHTQNNIAVTEKFLKAKIVALGKKNSPAEITVQGIALKK